jgi:2-polyprenyl-3-methyl-5-hydroxy-6-metoxy-1,4-benzoquinol methylase
MASRQGALTMSTTATERSQAVYALGHTPEEYKRLRLQARVWEVATGRLLDQVGLGPGASCLDAGCGPGETMRAMAQRVGPAGRVLGIDADPELGAMTLAMLHGAGHRQCSIRTQDLAAGEPIPGAPFDLVYARLLLFHLPQRVDVLARLWDAVAPGGHLLVQDYELRSISTLPQLDWVGELLRVWAGAFGAAGADVSTGTRLPQLFAQAGVGTPDGTDVAGRVEPLATGRIIVESAFRSVLPTALAHGVTTEADAAAVLASIDRDATRFPDRPLLWPLLIGAWKRKGQE